VFFYAGCIEQGSALSETLKKNLAQIRLVFSRKTKKRRIKFRKNDVSEPKAWLL